MSSFRGLPSDAIRTFKEPRLPASIAVDSVRGPFVSVGGRELLCFCSTDYLGLAQRPELAEAARKATAEFGSGTGSARGLSGTTRAHVQLEERLAEFFGTERALFLPSGSTANLALLPVLADAESVVLLDERAHPSLVDGARLSDARVIRYPHGSVDGVIAPLREHASVCRKFIVTDSVFGLDGDHAPLREVCGLGRFHGAEIVVDDAHGVGVFGPGGRGLIAHLGMDRQVTVRTGNLSKAFGSAGGYIAGSAALIEEVRVRGRAFVFTAAPPASVAAAGLAALELLEHADEERRRLWANVTELKARLRNASVEVRPSGSPIVSLAMGSSAAAYAASLKLREHGILLPPILPPIVPEQESRLRITLTALHEREQVERLADEILKW